MNRCDEVERFVGRLSGESHLPVPDDVALHLDSCPRCGPLFDQARVVVDPDVFERLAPSGRERMLRAIGRARAGRSWSPALAATAAVLLVAVVGVLYQALRSSPPAGASDPVAMALVEDHIRYMDAQERGAGGQADAYEAQLRSYVDFPLVIPSPPHARLTGARRCFLLGRRAALAFYDTPAGPASYFVFNGAGLQPPEGRCRGDENFSCYALHGYQVVSWKEAGLIHAYVGTDVPVLLEMGRSQRREQVNSG